MRDVLPAIDRWLSEGKTVALATVIQTWGSGPRGVGAKMASTEAAEIAGSVSGGCVESAVVAQAREVLQTGRPRLLHFGVADDTAWSVGLACGGTIEVFVERLDPQFYADLRKAIEEERPVATVTVVSGPEELLGRVALVRNDGSLVGELSSLGVEAARRALEEGTPRRQEVAPAEVFIDVILPPPRLVVVGGVHIAIALTTLARALGFWTAVVDPRQVFGSHERFPHADLLIQEWPEEAFARLNLNRSTAVTTLTHDPKIDDPSLRIALPSEAFYVGALGSRKTQEKRCQRLLEQGLGEDSIRRLHAPIGLDIGAQTPEEIALSVMGQIVATWHGKVG